MAGLLMEGLAALAGAGATALVGAMATDAWQVTRNGFARLFGRGDSGREELAERRLDDAAAALARASDGEHDRVRLEMLPAWRTRLEDLLEEDPQAAPDLEVLTEQIRAQLPAVQQVWVQNNVARYGGTVFAVQHGTQHIHDRHGATTPERGGESR